MATDLTPFVPPEKTAARQLAVAQIASAILEDATRNRRFPSGGEACPPLAGLAAQARTAIAINGAASVDRLAALVSGLRSKHINGPGMDAVVAEIESFAAETKIRSGGDLLLAARELREARMARLAYEQAHPAARLWRARTKRWRRWVVPTGGASETVGGGYILSQATRFPGGWVGGGIAMGALFGINLKLGQIVGQLGAEPGRRLRFKIKAVAVMGAAVGLDLVLGCLRADVPFTAVHMLFVDPVKYYAAWLVMSMEISVFFGAAAFSFKRMCAGDTVHYALLCRREEEADKALRAVRAAVEEELDDGTAESISSIAAQEQIAEDVGAAASRLYDDVHSERRGFRTCWTGIRAEAASVARDAYQLAIGQWNGAAPSRVPDFDKEMAMAVPEPTEGVAEMAVARLAAKAVREQVKDARRRAQKARVRVNAVRIDVLQVTYASV